VEPVEQANPIEVVGGSSSDEGEKTVQPVPLAQDDSSKNFAATDRSSQKSDDVNDSDNERGCGECNATIEATI